MNIAVLYGTESGNAEMAAEDLGERLRADHEVAVADLAGVDPASITTDTFYIVICSTYGEGELPGTAIPFHDSLRELAPDLRGVRYAIFGLGDSFYTETYSHGSEILDASLTEFGAVRVGEYGRHDASTFSPVSDVTLAWFDTLEPELSEPSPA